MLLITATVRQTSSGDTTADSDGRECPSPQRCYGGRVISFCDFDPTQSRSVTSGFSVAGRLRPPPVLESSQSGLQKVTKATKSLAPSVFESGPRLPSFSSLPSVK